MQLDIPAVVQSLSLHEPVSFYRKNIRARYRVYHCDVIVYFHTLGVLCNDCVTYFISEMVKVNGKGK